MLIIIKDIFFLGCRVLYQLPHHFILSIQILVNCMLKLYKHASINIINIHELQTYL